MKVTHKIDFYTEMGEPVHSFKIENINGSYAEFSNLGATWLKAVMPDAFGKMSNVLRGYNDLSEYLDDIYYMGATVGRFANRIANAQFEIDGQVYKLEANDSANTNHGGYSGFHKKLWEWKILEDGVRFSLISPDGEGGYPGEVNIVVDYRLNEADEISMIYRATTNRTTYLNITNHAYFNLSGTDKEIIYHQLMIPATHMLETTSDFIPTGEMVEVLGTPFDFSFPKLIGRDLNVDNEQLRWNRGYNHCYVLKEKLLSQKQVAAILMDPESGRCLTVETDLPGLVLYTTGYYAQPRTAVCLETQFFPDTPHYSHFPTCLLQPGEIYQHQTLFKFSNQADK